MDMMLIGGALAGIKNVLDIGRNIEDQKIVAAINSAVVDIQIKLIEAQSQILEVQEENRTLKEEVGTLQEQLKIEHEVVSHDGAYWKKLIGGTEDGPFCPRCWGLNKKLVYPSHVAEKNNGCSELICNEHTKPHEFHVPTPLVKRLGSPTYEGYIKDS